MRKGTLPERVSLKNAVRTQVFNINPRASSTAKLHRLVAFLRQTVLFQTNIISLTLFSRQGFSETHTCFFHFKRITPTNYRTHFRELLETFMYDTTEPQRFCPQMASKAYMIARKCHFIAFKRFKGKHKNMLQFCILSAYTWMTAFIVFAIYLEIANKNKYSAVIKKGAWWEKVGKDCQRHVKGHHHSRKDHWLKPYKCLSYGSTFIGPHPVKSFFTTLCAFSDLIILHFSL